MTYRRRHGLYGSDHKWIEVGGGVVVLQERYMPLSSSTQVLQIGSVDVTIVRYNASIVMVSLESVAIFDSQSILERNHR